MRRQVTFKNWAYGMIVQWFALATVYAGQDSASTAQSASGINENSAANTSNPCLSMGEGYFRARLGGSIDADIVWNDSALECSGASRPDGGARMRFGHPFKFESKFERKSKNAIADPKPDSPTEPQPLVFVLGIPGLREGLDANDLPVNITIIRQGSAQFFGTLGDNKCLIDALEQKPISGIPNRNRSYRVTGRGFCSQPAREINGDGLLLITRFDFAGRIDYKDKDLAPEPLVANDSPQPPP